MYYFSDGNCNYTRTFRRNTFEMCAFAKVQAVQPLLYPAHDTKNTRDADFT